MSHITLRGYFELNFSMMQFHKWSLTELENMMPWERDAYVILMKKHLEEEEQKQQNN